MARLVMLQARVEMYRLRAGRPRAGVDAIAMAKTGCLQRRDGGFGGRIPLNATRGRGKHGCRWWRVGAFAANTNIRYVIRKGCGSGAGRAEVPDNAILRG